jgi:hypothetical protein
MADESWIVDQETLDQAKQEALDALQALKPYGELLLTDDERQVLREVDGKQRTRISLIDGVLNWMGSLMADGYPDAVDTSALAPFQAQMEQAHDAAGEDLEAMAEHLDTEARITHREPPVVDEHDAQMGGDESKVE